jgi:hypothetical protein
MAKQPPKRPGRRDFTPVAVRPTHNGWSPQKQGAFIDALAESGCVHEACAHVGMSRQSAYALRMRPDAQGFRIAWDAALDFSVRRLTDETMSRAINGEVVPHYYKGELIGEHRRYDNKLAMFLLRYRDPLRYAASLDQMVYSGHPEAAAMAFMKARNRMTDEAWGVADASAADPDATGLPFTRTILPEEEVRQSEQAIIEGDAPIHGTSARRERLGKLRVDHFIKKQEEAKAAAEAKAKADAEAERHAQAARPAYYDRDRAADERRARALAEATSEEERAAIRRIDIEERAKRGEPDALASFLSTLEQPDEDMAEVAARSELEKRARRGDAQALSEFLACDGIPPDKERAVIAEARASARWEGSLLRDAEAQARRAMPSCRTIE